MTSVFRVGATALIDALALVPPAGASPVVGRGLIRPQACRGFLKKVFRPKIDLGKGARALTYPVKKAAVNGGKAAAGAAASYYIASKRPGIPAVLPKK